MSDWLQILGAILVLVAFMGSQMGRLRTTSLVYLVLNVVGAGVLAVLAALGRQWGFLLLEGTWALVALVSLARALFSKRPPAEDAGPIKGR